MRQRPGTMQLMRKPQVYHLGNRVLIPHPELQTGPDLGQAGRGDAEHWSVPSAAWTTAI